MKDCGHITLTYLMKKCENGAQFCEGEKYEGRK